MASSRDPLTLTGSILTVDTSGSYLFPSQITSPFTESKQPLVTTTVIDITNTLTPGGSLTCYPAITMSISGTILNVTGSTTSLATGAPLVINYATYTYTPGPAGINGQYSLDDKVTLSAVSTAYGPNVTFWQSVYVSLDQYQSSITLNSGSTAMPTLIGGSSLHSASSVPSTSMAPSPGSTASSSRNATSSTSGTKSSTSGGSSHTGIHKAAHKYSSGEIAGAAVGTGVGAAILAFLLAFLLRSRRRSNLDRSRSLARASPGSPPPFVEKSSTSKAPQIVDIMPFTGGSSSWMEHLPQPMDDETMRRTIKTLHDQIQLHVENFYHDVAVPQVSETAQTELYRLDSELVHPSLYKLMLQAKAKTALIKHSLAHLLFTSIDHNEASRTGHTSFLPQEFVGLLAIRGLEQRSYQAPSLKPATSQALSQYRVLTSYLRPNPATDRVYLQQRDININTAATSFVKAFGPSANHSQSERARFDNLVEIMRSAAEVGIVVFSQPATYEYQWKDDDAGSGNGRASRGNNVVVLPAFVKVTDDIGNKLERPYVVVRASSAAV